MASPEYWKHNVLFARGPATSSDAGQAAEFLVASDILARGLRATKPLNVNGADDLHIKVSGVWYTVQIKSGSRNRRTGTLSLCVSGGRSAIASDIIAVVFLPTREIRYIANRAPVPPELQTELTVLYSGGASSQSSSSSALDAKR